MRLLIRRFVPGQHGNTWMATLFSLADPSKALLFLSIICITNWSKTIEKYLKFNYWCKFPYDIRCGRVQLFHRVLFESLETSLLPPFLTWNGIAYRSYARGKTCAHRRWRNFQLPRTHFSIIPQYSLWLSTRTTTALLIMVSRITGVPACKFVKSSSHLKFFKLK